MNTKPEQTMEPALACNCKLRADQCDGHTATFHPFQLGASCSTRPCERVQPNKQAAEPATSPTTGMNMAQRILHVGGRNNAAGYVEFGSIQAVEALVRQVLRDLPTQQPLTELVEYILQDDIHNRLTPRVIDIAYSAWCFGRSGKNKDDGGPCDWFNDTKPMVTEQLQKIRKDLAEAAHSITGNKT